MYKVFLNNRYILLSSQPDRHQNYCLFYKFHDDEDLYKQIFAFINNPDCPAINIYCDKIDLLWKIFKDYFVYREAAGGIVKHSSGLFLFIERHGKWDIPKGHLKSDEENIDAARREISEECGIIPGSIIDTFRPSYHIYPLRDHYCLKKTSWFMFNYDGQLGTRPQEKEGISKAEWIKPDYLNEIVHKTWSSLSEIIQEVILQISKE